MADTDHTILHVKDAYHFDVPRLIVPSGQLKIAQPFASVPEGEEKLVEVAGHHGVWVPNPQAKGIYISKFMILEVLAAFLMFLVFTKIAKAMRKSNVPRGRFANLMETFLVYVRDAIAKPNIGESDAPAHTPFLWNIFFFVLFCNLLGMLPWLGSPTGALGTTSALAIITFLWVVRTGTSKFGFVGYSLSLVPHMDLDWYMALTLKPMLWVIELIGLILKHAILAIRLLANMFAGHVVLVVIMGFIVTPAIAESVVWYGVMPASVAGAVGISCLELFVAFLQAYIFTFLSALFIGAAVHPH